MNWHNDDLIRMKHYHHERLKHVPLQSIIKRYETLIKPRLSAENNDTFNPEKMQRFSIQLMQSLLKDEDIYPCIDLMVKNFCKHHTLTEFEASFAVDFMLMIYLDQLSNDHLIADEHMVQLFLKIQYCDVALLNVIVRNACGYHVIPGYDHLLNWLASDACQVKKIVKFSENDQSMVLKFDQQQDHLNMIHDAALHQQYVEKKLTQAKARYAIGLYGEDRACYQAPMFASPGCAEKRSVHLGLDIFTKSQEPIYAPIPGKVFSIQYNAEKLDYGHTLIMKHKIPGHNISFYTLYGHLSEGTLSLVSAGDKIDAGQKIGYLGDHHENGGWSPHLHFQIITDLLSCEGDFYGACEPSMWYLWQQICPDPSLLLKVNINKGNGVLD